MRHTPQAGEVVLQDLRLLRATDRRRKGNIRLKDHPEDLDPQVLQIGTATSLLDMHPGLSKACAHRLAISTMPITIQETARCLSLRTGCQTLTKDHTGVHLTNL